MKKLVALACAAVLSVSMAVPAMADPSIFTVTEAEAKPVEVENVTGELAQVLAEDETLALVMVPADTAKVMDAYTEAYTASGELTEEVKQNIEHLGEAIDALNDVTKKNSVADLVEILTDDAAKPQTITKADGTTVTIDPADYGPITTIHNLALNDADNTVITADGKLRAGLSAFNELLKDSDLDKLIIVQYDPLTGEVYYVEVQVDENSAYFADFPCTGPFFIASR